MKANDTGYLQSTLPSMVSKTSYQPNVTAKMTLTKSRINWKPLELKIWKERLTLHHIILHGLESY